MMHENWKKLFDSVLVLRCSNHHLKGKVSVCHPEALLSMMMKKGMKENEPLDLGRKTQRVNDSHLLKSANDSARKFFQSRGFICPKQRLKRKRFVCSSLISLFNLIRSLLTLSESLSSLRLFLPLSPSLYLSLSLYIFLSLSLSLPFPSSSYFFSLSSVYLLGICCFRYTNLHCVALLSFYSASPFSVTGAH